MESEAAGEGEAEQKKLKVEGKELARLRKCLEEEKSKRELAETESKTLKVRTALPTIEQTLISRLQATLKSAQSELKLSEKSLVAANRTAELANRAAEIAQATLISAAALTSSSAALPVAKPSKPKAIKAKVAALPVKATRRRKSMLADMSIEEEEMNSSFVVTEDEEEESMDTSLMVEAEEVSLVKAAPPAKPAKVKKAPVIAKVKKVAAASDSDEDDGSVYRAIKPVPRAASATPAPVAAPRAVPVAPVVAPVKKAKAAPKPKVMLGDKSTNAKAAKKASIGSVTASKGKGKRDLSVLVEATEEESMAVAEPAKKKKKSLFLGPKKFEWAKVIEVSIPFYLASVELTWSAEQNADVNSLGLPSALSPVKASTDGKRTSIGTMGRGLSGGRKSIFA